MSRLNRIFLCGLSTGKRFLLGVLLMTAAEHGRALAVEEATIADVHAAFLSGRLTARQLVTAYLERIAAYDQQGPYINSIINLNADALLQADALDAALKRTGKLSGPLHGVPVLVKDCIDAVGMPMTAGFQGWKNYIPPVDAPLVANIKAAGGIILGKASLSEFTRGGGDNINSVLAGYSRNPYNTAFATGGSSGGYRRCHSSELRPGGSWHRYWRLHPYARRPQRPGRFASHGGADLPHRHPAQ
ncbi:MAG: amidase [Cellvibrionaceae bacterium]|nr:amidase [Cellvibrionaceae bacterium]